LVSEIGSAGVLSTRQDRFDTRGPKIRFRQKKQLKRIPIKIRPPTAPPTAPPMTAPFDVDVELEEPVLSGKGGLSPVLFEATFGEARLGPPPTTVPMPASCLGTRTLSAVSIGGRPSNVEVPQTKEQ